jgi:hypothetical protein
MCACVLEPVNVSTLLRSQVYAVPSLDQLANIPAQTALRGCIWKPPQDSVQKVSRAGQGHTLYSYLYLGLARTICIR